MKEGERSFCEELDLPSLSLLALLLATILLWLRALVLEEEWEGDAGGGPRGGGRGGGGAMEEEGRVDADIE